MSLMAFTFLRHCLRISPRIRIVRKNIVTLSGTKNLVKDCWRAVTDNAIFTRIHGCTAEEVLKDLDLGDKTCLITGANSGIGLEMTKCLNAHGCTVIMACRNKYAASSIAKNICDNKDNLRVYETNLASLKSVKDCSDKIVKNEQKIDIVLLNAAVFGLPWTLTEDELETTFQVNYLSQFYLLLNIESLLASDARVVFVSSESHRNINWSIQKALEPTEEMLSLPQEHYTSIKAYNISKLCGILAMHYLGYRWLNSGKQVFSAHPGSFVKTKLCHNWWVYETLYTFMQPFSKSVSQAASTPIYCATSPELNGLSAIYYKNCERCQESELAKDFHLSFRVYDISCDMIRARMADSEKVLTRVSKPSIYRERLKEILDDSLLSNYASTFNS